MARFTLSATHPTPTLHSRLEPVMLSPLFSLLPPKSYALSPPMPTTKAPLFSQANLDTIRIHHAPLLLYTPSHPFLPPLIRILTALSPTSHHPIPTINHPSKPSTRKPLPSTNLDSALPNLSNLARSDELVKILSKSLPFYPLCSISPVSHIYPIHPIHPIRPIYPTYPTYPTYQAESTDAESTDAEQS